MATSPIPDPAPAAWSRFWQAGVLHSCGGAFGGNYDGPVADFWNAQFARLGDGAVVVDVGTGNGAVALLAKAAAGARGLRFELHGTDVADIDPPASGSRPAGDYAGIRFHPRTPMQHLPFADGGVDLLTSQYAFEYAPREAAVGEIARVLGKRGRAALVLHSRDSVVFQTTQEQLATCRFLFDASALFDRARAMIPFLARATTDAQRRALAANADAEAARRSLNAAVGAVLDRAAALATPDILRKAIDIVAEALRRSAGMGERATLAWLGEGERKLRDEWLRLRDLEAAALDEAGMAALREDFLRHGIAVVRHAPIRHQGGALLGWAMTAGND